MNDLVQDIGTVDLTGEVDALRRRWWLIALVTVASVIASIITVSIVPRTYESSAAVLVLPVSGETSADVSGARTTSEINLDTEAQLIRSVEMAEHVALALETSESPRDLAEQVDVTVPPNSQVLTITFTAATARGAHDGAAAYAQAYLDQRQSSAESVIDEQVEVYQNRLTALNSELTTVNSQLADPKLDAATRSTAVSRRDSLSSQISTLESTIADLQLTTVSPGKVITSANTPTSAATPIVPLYLAVGVMLGLIAGVLLVLIMARLDHRVRSPRDLSHLRRARLFGSVIPALPSPGQYAGLAVEDQVDQLRMIVDNSGTEITSPGIIQVAPMGSDAQTGALAATLARSYARRLGRCLLVVAESTDTTVSTALGLDGVGLTDLISGRVATLKPVVLDHMGVRGVGPGTVPERLRVVLQRSLVLEHINRIRDGATVVIVTDSLTGSAGSQAVATFADRLLLVGVAGELDDRVAATAVDAAASIGVASTIALIQPRRKSASTEDEPIPAPPDFTSPTPVVTVGAPDASMRAPRGAVERLPEVAPPGAAAPKAAGNLPPVRPTSPARPVRLTSTASPQRVWAPGPIDDGRSGQSVPPRPDVQRGAGKPPGETAPERITVVATGPEASVFPVVGGPVSKTPVPEPGAKASSAVKPGTPKPDAAGSEPTVIERK